MRHYFQTVNSIQQGWIIVFSLKKSFNSKLCLNKIKLSDVC